MRLFEIIILLVCTVLPFIKRPVLRKLESRYVLIGLGLILVIHFFAEGWRWQMIPGYLLLIILLWRVKVVDAMHPPKLSFLRILGFFGIIILALLGWVLPSVLPIFSLPEPTGEYAVGTESRYVQTDRDEIITEDPDDKRELMYKIWYPSTANVSGKERDAYVDRTSRAGFATKYGLPPTALNYLDRVKTHVYPDIPVADGTFPVLIFSHGYGSKATGYYSILTELASQGYIIINMNHTFESLGTTFPDGRQAYFDFGFQHEISKDAWSQIEPILEVYKSGISYEERHPIVKEFVTTFYESKSMDRWAEDMIETMDLLENWNKEGTLAGRLDLEQLGLFGHSNGGGSAGKVPLVDERVKAVANLDGISWGNVIDTTYQIPFLFVSADWPAEKEDFNTHIYINKSTDYFYESRLLQSGHPNFMDIPFMIPVPAIAGTGSIEPALGSEITNKLVTSFFDKHLKGVSTADPQLVGEQYAELELTVFKGDSVKHL